MKRAKKWNFMLPVLKQKMKKILYESRNKSSPIIILSIVFFSYRANSFYSNDLCHFQLSLIFMIFPNLFFNVRMCSFLWQIHKVEMNLKNSCIFYSFASFPYFLIVIRYLCLLLLIIVCNVCIFLLLRKGKCFLISRISTE